jgi:hypothetical protein
MNSAPAELPQLASTAHIASSSSAATLILSPPPPHDHSVPNCTPKSQDPTAKSQCHSSVSDCELGPQFHHASTIHENDAGAGAAPAEHCAWEPDNKLEEHRRLGQLGLGDGISATAVSIVNARQLETEDELERQHEPEGLPSRQSTRDGSTETRTKSASCIQNSTLPQLRRRIDLEDVPLERIYSTSSSKEIEQDRLRDIRGIWDERTRCVYACVCSFHPAN